MKETGEFVNALGSTAAQAVTSFADGAQITDFADFIDEALSYDAAIRGLVSGFPTEARQAQAADIEALFEQQRTKLLAAGMHPMLAGAIVTHAKGIYYTYAAVVQTGQPVVSQEYRKQAQERGLLPEEE